MPASQSTRISGHINARVTTSRSEEIDEQEVEGQMVMNPDDEGNSAESFFREL